MAVASAANGTQAATISTEHYLGSQINTPGVYTLCVDLSNMVNGDKLEITIYTTCNSSASLQVAYKEKYANIQRDKNIFSIPVMVTNAIICSIKQTAGTGRTFYWNLMVS